MKIRTRIHKDEETALLALYLEFSSWPKVAHYLTKKTTGHLFSPSLIRRIAKCGKTAPNSVLNALGLPLRKVLAPPCPNCGQAHAPKPCKVDKMQPGYRLPVEQFIIWAREREAVYGVRPSPEVKYDKHGQVVH
jgi:hypothetical protein